MHMPRSKRSRFIRASCLALALALTGAPALLRPAPARAADQQPIKVGLIIPVTGAFAALGQYMKEGLDLYLQEHDYTLGGRKIVIDEVDDRNIPSVALTQVRKLVEQDHVDLLFGVASASIGTALVPYVTQHKIPTIYPIVSSDDLSQRTPVKYIVRTGWTSSLTTHVLGDYAYKTLKYRKVATIGYDFQFGWESIDGFVDTFQRDGGKVVKELWTPLSTTDFSPYLSEIPRDVDAVVCSFSGTLAVNFIQQYRSFGLKMPLICQGNATDESTLAKTGPAAVGIIGALQYSAALDTPANKKFVAAYTKAFGHGPGYYGEGSYIGAQVLGDALDAVHGDVSNTDAFLKALHDVKITDAARGPIHFDQYGGPVENVYIRKIEMVNGQLENVVIKTYPNVSQFWTYDPSQYLKQPSYGRDYPPCNACK